MLLYGTPLMLKEGKYRVHKVISLHGTSVSMVAAQSGAAGASCETPAMQSSAPSHRHRQSLDTGAQTIVEQSVHPDNDSKDFVMRCAIAVRSPEKSFVLVADTERECADWLEAIQGATKALADTEVEDFCLLLLLLLFLF